MSSSSPVGQSCVDWSILRPYVVNSIAGGSAIAVAFPLLIAKSALQIGKPIPTMKFTAIVIGSCKAAPNVGAIVALQMGLQEKIEHEYLQRSDNREAAKNSLTLKLITSCGAAIPTSPLLAVLNALSLNCPAKEALKTLSANQIALITVRETSFVFSLRAIEPITKTMKTLFGDNKATEYGSAALSGGIGSYFGHIPDTLLSMQQSKLKVENVRQLIRGAHVRASALATFSVIYKLIKNSLNQ